ncbi:family 78 glycoside hydrolase catalytic domain [Paenibacillus sp. GCM10027626]|uniref:family 78 glycoside hydrolase catalytic domain n=1 Tax=Paenibacillus sp. GCM10027626 TaxID=3273411 RepID=UPI00362C4647
MNNIRNARFVRPKPPGESWGWLPETGLIWHPDEVETHYEQPLNSYCRFRRTFDADEDVARAVIRLFADSRYMLYVNGSYAGRGPCRSDPRWQYVDEIDITRYIRKGRNTIAILALYYGYGTGQSIRRIPALLAEARLETPSRMIGIAGDGSWKCILESAYNREAPRINGCQGPVEYVDARLADQDWIKPDYSDEGWQAAKRRSIRLSPFWNLVPRPIPLLHERQIDCTAVVNRGSLLEKPEPVERRHRQIIAEEEGITIADSKRRPLPEMTLEASEEHRAHLLTCDFGRIEPGYLQIEVSAPVGTVIDAVYAEELWEGKALLNEDNNRSFDTFVCREGRNSFEVAFGWKACRYVQLRVRNPDGNATLHRVGMRKRTYPVMRHSSFTCSDDTIRTLWGMCEHTLRICMQDAFVDSPSREQQQWMGDGRWQAVMNHYYTGDSRLHRKLLEQIGQSQDWHGMTSSRYPDGHHNYPPIPSFCLQWICSFDEYRLNTGDDALIEEWWPNIVQAVRWFTAFENESGLLADIPYWPYIDAGESPDGRQLDTAGEGVVTALNLQYLESLRKASGYAQLVNDREAQAHYARKADRLAASIRRHLWNADAGAYSDRLTEDGLSGVISEPTNALALLHLHLPEEAESGTIFANVFAGSSRQAVAGSPYFMLVVCRALAKIGQPDRAFELIRERYAPMVAAGSTTVWEWWKLFYKEQSSGKVRFSSASHAWAGAPLVFCLEEIIGIKQAAPGFRRVTVTPRLCGLQWAEGTVVTSGGELRIRVEDRGRELALRMSVPPGCTAHCGSREYGAGEHEVVMSTNGEGCGAR